MIPAGLSQGLAKLRAHPVTFLLAINMACAALGLAQFAFTLTLLGPEDFAVIGVLAAIGGVVVGLLDVKLADLATRLFFAAPKEEPRRRAALLSASLVLHLAASVVIAVLMLAAGLLLGPRFLSQGLDGWWAAAMAARAAAVHPTSALGASLRLVGAFRASGWLRLATQLLVTAVTILALTASPSLAGYFAGTAVATALALVLGLVVAARQVRRALDAPLVRLAPRVVFEQYLAAGRFLAGGSLAGLAKLFSRSADTLVVAALTNDTVTGLYRVARQAYDNLAGLSDAVHQFYTPTIVDCIAGGRWDEYARHRRRLMLIGAAAAAGAVLLSSAVLRPLALARYPQYLPALPAFEVLAGLLLVTLGIHGWMWPSLVAADRVGLFGVLGLAGAIAQLGTIAALAALGVLDATTAAAAAWVMAALNYGPVVAALWHQRLKRQA